MPAIDQVIIFTRYPQPGRVKTRLIPKLGKVGAAAIHKKMAEHILSKINDLQNIDQDPDSSIQLNIYYTGASHKQMTQWLGNSIPFFRQQGEGLGNKMFQAFQSARDAHFQRTILIGSDCPSINTNHIRLAFKHLKKNNLVLGPTYDGGYYLIGTDNSIPITAVQSLFSNISWGTEKVYKQTLNKAKKAGLSFYPMQKLNDIDRPQDLEYFNYHSNP